MTKKAVWLDRDGVLNADTGYTYKLNDLLILPGIVTGLKTLQDNQFDLFVITNQSGIARGLFSEDDVNKFHQKMEKIFKSEDILIKKFSYCPHHIQGIVPEYTKICECRKPGIGMIAPDLKNYQPRKCFLIGDRSSDIDCAENAGINGILIKSEYAKDHTSAIKVVENFTMAVEYIVQSTS